MTDDFLKTLREQLLDRFSSPFLASFGLSWAAWNYKFLVLLFSQNSATATFKLISEISFPEGRHVMLYGVIYPALSAAAFLIVHPHLNRLVDKYLRKQQNALIKQRNDIDGAVQYTEEQSRELRTHYRKLESELREDLNQERAKNEALSRRVTAQEDEISRLEGELEAKGKELAASMGSGKIGVDAIPEKAKAALQSLADEDELLRLIDQLRSRTMRAVLAVGGFTGRPELNTTHELLGSLQRFMNGNEVEQAVVTLNHYLNERYQRNAPSADEVRLAIVAVGSLIAWLEESGPQPREVEVSNIPLYRDQNLESTFEELRGVTYRVHNNGKYESGVMVVPLNTQLKRGDHVSAEIGTDSVGPVFYRDPFSSAVLKAFDSGFVSKPRKI